jgi:hypothetical protein
MSKQKKLKDLNLSELDNLDLLSEILELEKKYFEFLWKLFTSKDFVSDLEKIETDIKKNYKLLSDHWDLKNKIKIPAERLVRHYIYKSPLFNIVDIYPSPVSADIALITEDIVLNIDVKTIDIVGNSGDLQFLQFLPNQSTFINRKLSVDPLVSDSGIQIDSSLPLEYNLKKKRLPVLTFFLTIVYSDNGSTFSLAREKNTPTINLKCLPSGIISKLFDFDLVKNFKAYKYYSDNLVNHIFIKGIDLKQELVEYVKSNPDFKIVKVKSKEGLFNPKAIHPISLEKGITWVRVKRKVKGKFKLEPIIGGSALRIKTDDIRDRYDSCDLIWQGDRDFYL